MGKLKILYIVSGNVNWCIPYGNGSSPEIKNRTTYDPVIPLLDTYPEEFKSWSQRDISTLIFIAALLIIAKMWKQPKCSLMDEWIKKMWYMHTIKCYSAFEKKENLQHPTMWVNLEDITPGEISQPQQTDTVWFQLYEVS